jgi:hypothetical protein
VSLSESFVVEKANLRNVLLFLAAGGSLLSVGISLLTMSLVLTWRYGSMPEIEARASAAVFLFAGLGAALLVTGGLLFQLRALLGLHARGWLSWLLR